MNVLQRNFIEKFLSSFVENIVTLDNQQSRKLHQDVLGWEHVNKSEISKRKAAVFLYGFELYKNQGRNDMLPSFVLYIKSMK